MKICRPIVFYFFSSDIYCSNYKKFNQADKKLENVTSILEDINATEISSGELINLTSSVKQSVQRMKSYVNDEITKRVGKCAGNFHANIEVGFVK